MKNNITNIIVKIVFGIILVISLYLIISGLLEKEEKQTNKNNNEVLETGLTIEPNSINIIVGEEKEIVATIIPDNATYKNLTWEAGNQNIISLDNGLVKGLSPGTTFIRVTTEKQKITRVINVNVSNEIIDVKEIKPLESNIELYIGDTKKIEYEILPSNATNKKISYSIDNKEVAGFNKEGLIVAVKEGKATVTLKSNNDITSTINVVVKTKEIPVTSVSLSSTKLTLEVNKEKELKATIKPEEATDKTLTWSSSNDKVATVKDGKVKGIKEGEATITVKTSNGKTATTKVTVGSPTKNKTAIFFGDSITMGSTNYSWANYIGDHYDLKSSVNAGKSGGVLSNSRDADRWIVNVVKKYKDKSFDYVIMHGGINDCSMGVSLGTFTSDDFSGNYNTKTVLGGLEYYIYTVKKQWPKAKLGYIINYKTPRATEVNKRSDKYYSEIKKVLKKWNISYIDLYSGKTPNGQTYSDLLKVNTSTYIPDAVHLNREGYNILTPYIYEWMKTL